jgi:putative flippase GtrA
MVGTVCCLINLLSFWLLIEFIKVHYLVATIINFFLINYFGFELNRALTFATNKSGYWVYLSRYFLVMLFSLTSNLLLMYLLVNYLSIHYLLSSLLVTVIFFLVNFTLHNFWTFRS